MTQPSTQKATEGEHADALSRSQTVLMVSAVAVSVAAFMLNATMLSPAIRDINAHLGPQANASMSAYFYLCGAICNVVLIRWSDYIGRKNSTQHRRTVAIHRGTLPL